MATEIGWGYPSKVEKPKKGKPKKGKPKTKEEAKPQNEK